ncbi:MAG: VOC family protein [Gammaproteobacteria bacterium]
MKPDRASAPHAPFLRLLLSIIALVLLAGCASNPPWPAITEEETTTSTPGRWIWAELFTSDVAEAKAFYGSVFGWQFETRGTREKPYTLVLNEGKPVAGMLRHPAAQGDALRSRWVGLVSVTNVDAATESMREAGGAVLLDPVNLPGRGKVALAADPEGARFGVLATESGDPADVMPEAGGWLWHELWAHSARNAGDFYTQTLGYSIKRASRAAGKVEWHLVAGGYPRAGIIEHGASGLPSAWLHYVRVADVDATIERVKKAGGSLLIAPTREFRQGRAAVIVDPMGAPMGIAEWPEAMQAGVSR